MNMTPHDETDRSRPSPSGERVLVVVPTFNEVDNLPGLVVRVLEALPRASVLVVDDGSPDGTGDLADRLAEVEPRLGVMHHQPRAGLGAAYCAAFRYVVGHYTADEVAWVAQMDADGSHAPDELPDLLSATADADVALGSRYVPGGRVVDWPRRRYALSRVGNIYSRLALGLRVHDVTGGFRVFRREVLEKIPVDSVASQGYCFQVDMLRRVDDAGFTVAEVPITFRERERGTSKMSGAIVREALWRVTVWGVVGRRDTVVERVRRLRSGGGR